MANNTIQYAYLWTYSHTLEWKSIDEEEEYK